MFLLIDQSGEGKDITLKETIHLNTGETVEAEVSGRSLDGQTGSAYIIPSGEYASLADYIQAGHEVDLEKNPDGTWSEKKGE